MEKKLNKRKGNYGAHHGKAKYWPKGMGPKKTAEIEDLIEKFEKRRD